MPNDEGGPQVPIKRSQSDPVRLPNAFGDDQFWRPLNEFLGQFKSFVDQLSGAKAVVWREYPDMLVAEMGLPGLTKSDIEVRIDEGARRVTVTGKTRTRKDGTLIEQTFQQAFLVPSQARVDRARAKLENGLLKIGFARSARETTRTIGVE